MNTSVNNFSSPPSYRSTDSIQMLSKELLIHGETSRNVVGQMLAAEEISLIRKYFENFFEMSETRKKSRYSSLESFAKSLIICWDIFAYQIIEFNFIIWSFSKFFCSFLFTLLLRVKFLTTSKLKLLKFLPKNN